MNNTKINVPLLRKTLEFVSEHPEEWNQRTWGYNFPCGTVGCFAHHACRLSGAEFVDAQHVLAAPGDPRDRIFVHLGKRVVHVSDRARRALGVENANLFGGANTLGDLREMVRVLIARAEG